MTRTLAAIAALAILSGVPAMAQDQQRPTADQAPLFDEPSFISRVIDFATRTVGAGGDEKNGLYPEVSSIVTGSGWISLGPGYRRWMGGDNAFLDVAAAMSWRSYKLARGRFELTRLARSRVAVGTEFRWQDLTQVSYFGRGAETIEADRSEYRLKSLDTVGYSNVRPWRWMTIGGRVGWLRSPSVLEPGGRFRRDYPATASAFPGEASLQLDKQPDFLHSELSVTADTRDNRSHPLAGGVYRGSWSRYSDRDRGHFSFQRFEAESLHVRSTRDRRASLALRGWLLASDTAEGREIPFYLLPSLGGNNTLRGYSSYRLHDRHFVVANAEVRVAVLRQLDLAIFADAGNVAARMADLNFDRRSIGMGVRLHSAHSTFARFDVAHGSEGWRVVLSTRDPLHLSRLSHRAAPVPFVP